MSEKQNFSPTIKHTYSAMYMFAGLGELSQESTVLNY